MLSQPVRSLPIMFAFLFGFATINAEEIPDGIMPQKRQVAGTGVTSSSTTSSTSSTPTTSNTPTTSSTSDSGTTSTPDTSTSIPITTSNSDGTTSTTNVQSTSLTSDVQTRSGTVKVGSQTIDASTLSHKTTVRAPLVTKATRHSTFTSTWTTNGEVHSQVYTTQNVFASTTGYATATIAPSLAHEGGNGSNLSTNTKKIIGGVVGGIGGAVLIGGLAFVAWRLWGKKKNEEAQKEEVYSNDSLNASTQKRYSQNTLATEPYSNPNGAVNTASNF